MGKNKNKNKKVGISSTPAPASTSAYATSAPPAISMSHATTVPLLPFVSICTPTFNRRPFIPYMIKCFEHQDYPKDRMEWIIIDDGTDKIEDLVKHIPQVKYFAYEKKLFLGNKRNIMHDKSKGEIIVYMDDDDYYPPDRVSHAVERLQQTPSALCAGSSELYIYFKHIQKMYQFGPYGPTHSTAGTFAFKRKLLRLTRYEDDAALAEEKHFLKNYTIPFVQLDPMKAILVFSHDHNTFDKRRLLVNNNPSVTKESSKTVDMFIKDPDFSDFYINRIPELLKTYEPGRPNMKPDVLIQMVAIEKQRKKEQEKQQQMPVVTFQSGDGPAQQFTMEQVVQLLQQQQTQIGQLTNLLQGKENEIKMLTAALNRLPTPVENSPITYDLQSLKSFYG